MPIDLKKEVLKGVIPPMVTPLKSQSALDVEGLERLTSHVLNGGVHGLFILGTTGEAPSLSYKLRYELLERVCKQVEGKVPVLVGITDSAAHESLDMAHKAAEHNADAVVAAPPFYYSYSQSELTDYYNWLADESPLPLYLYNMPSHTKIWFEPDTVAALSNHPNIIGFKDSSANLGYFQKVKYRLEGNDDFSVLIGPEEMLMQTVLSGAHGGVNGGANLFPEIYVNMYEAAVAKDFEQMIPLQQKILHISNHLYSIGSSPSSYMQGVKGALALLGICDGTLAVPLKSFEKEEQAILHKNLNKLKSLGVV